MSSENKHDPNNPTPPDSLEDRLRREEPPVDADDTTPTRSLNRIDEPPPSEEDTAPHAAISLDERLQQDEPPVAAGDTSPSLVSQEMRLVEGNAGGSPPTRFQRALAAAMLAGAVLLTAAAALIWLDGEDAAPQGPSADLSPESSSPLATDSPEQSASSLAQASPTPHSQAPATGPTAVALFPTAAAEEIAAALLTPAPNIRPARAIQRENNPFTIRPAEARAGVVQYTVQQGDTLESIASRFNLSDFYTIIWSNETSKVNPLRPGNTLNILPEDGVFYEVTENITIGQLAERYDVDPYAIIDADYNNLDGSTPDTVLVAGMGRIAIPGGKGERINLLPAATTSTGSAGGGAISGTYNLWGCTSNIGGGTLPVSRPLQGGYTWMQGFSLGGHEGVDLSPTMGVGEPVHAAGSGTVAFAGWNNYGYGYVVVIGHGPYFTLYGHLNSYSVRCGQSVSAGQVIGTVGNTGNSSGPHLHFEVRDADWNARNPLDFVGF